MRQQTVATRFSTPMKGPLQQTQRNRPPINGRLLVVVERTKESRVPGLAPERVARTALSTGSAPGRIRWAWARNRPEDELKRGLWVRPQPVTLIGEHGSRSLQPFILA